MQAHFVPPNIATNRFLFEAPSLRSAAAHSRTQTRRSIYVAGGFKQTLHILATLFLHDLPGRQFILADIRIELIADGPSEYSKPVAVI